MIRLLMIILILSVSTIFMTGCDNSVTDPSSSFYDWINSEPNSLPFLPEDITHNNNSSSNDPGKDGPYKTDSYQSGRLNHKDIGDAEMFYPTNAGSGPFAATTVTGGWINRWEHVGWVVNRYATHGMIVLALTPPNRVLATPHEWERLQFAGIKVLLEENNNPDSPIYQKVNEDRVGICGYSMGGGGIIRLADRLEDKVSSIVVLAPWLMEKPQAAKVRIPIILISGTGDKLSWQWGIEREYSLIAPGTPKMWANFDGLTHRNIMILFGRESEKQKVSTYMISWHKCYLENKTGEFMPYLIGDKHDEHVANDWFADFKFENMP